MTQRPASQPQRQENARDERPRENARPLISKEKEMEIKRQLEEAKKKAIDEEVIADADEPEFVSLKVVASTGKKELSRENKNALKDALLKVLQQNGAPAKTHVEIRQQEVKTTQSETVTIDTDINTSFQKPSEAVESAPFTPRPFVKHVEPETEKSQPEPLQQQEEQPVREPIKPGEIPEDELKRLLEVK